MITYETNYLAHHGVKGMRWGYRKRRVSKGRTRRQIRNEYRQKNASRVKAYEQSTVAKRNKARTYGRAVGGLFAAAGATAGYYALSKIGTTGVTRIAGSAAVGVGSYFIASRITTGITNVAQGTTKKQLKNRG